MLGSTLGTAFGSLAGLAFGAPQIGAAAGGFLGGLFDKPAQAPQYRDLTDPRLSAIAGRLENSHLGADMAARERVLSAKNAQDSVDKAGNNPYASRNPMLQSAVYNQAYNSAEDTNINAALKGSQIDQNAQSQAAQIEAQNQSISESRNAQDLQRFQLNANNPSLSDVAATNVFGYALGGLLSGDGKGGGANPTGTTDTTLPNLAPPSNPAIPGVANPALGDPSQFLSGNITDTPTFNAPSPMTPFLPSANLRGAPSRLIQRPTWGDWWSSANSY